MKPIKLQEVLVHKRYDQAYLMGNKLLDLSTLFISENDLKRNIASVNLHVRNRHWKSIQDFPSVTIHLNRDLQYIHPDSLIERLTEIVFQYHIEAMAVKYRKQEPANETQHDQHLPGYSIPGQHIPFSVEPLYPYQPDEKLEKLSHCGFYLKQWQTPINPILGDETGFYFQVYTDETETDLVYDILIIYVPNVLLDIYKGNLLERFSFVIDQFLTEACTLYQRAGEPIEVSELIQQKEVALS